MEDIAEEIFEVLEQLREDFAQGDAEKITDFLKSLFYGERVEDAVYHYLNRS